jgi:hypothetical protein
MPVGERPLNLPGSPKSHKPTDACVSLPESGTKSQLAS